MEVGPLVCSKMPENIYLFGKVVSAGEGVGRKEVRCGLALPAQVRFPAQLRWFNGLLAAERI